MLGGGYRLQHEHDERCRRAEGLTVKRRDATAVVVDRRTAHTAVVALGVSRPTVLDSIDAADVRTLVVDGTKFRVHRGSAVYTGLPGITPIACTCKDWSYRGTRRENVNAALGCKHMIATELFLFKIKD